MACKGAGHELGVGGETTKEGRHEARKGKREIHSMEREWVGNTTNDNMGRDGSTSRITEEIRTGETRLEGILLAQRCPLRP